MALLPILPRLATLKKFYLTSLKLMLPFISPFPATNAKLKDASGAVPLNELLAAVPKQCSLFQVDHLTFEPPKVAAMPLLVSPPELPIPRFTTARLLLYSQQTEHAVLAVRQGTLCRMVDLDGAATWVMIHVPRTKTPPPASTATHNNQQAAH